MQLSVRDAARFLGVSEKTIYRWIKDGVLPAYRVNEQYRFNQTELLEWATERKMTVSAEVLGEPNGGGRMPTLVKALEAGGVFHNVGGAGKESVLQAVVDHMPLPKNVDRAFLLQVLLARESMGSTGIGDGVAIPHVRNPIVLHVTEPIITLCFLEHPIDFGAIDGKAVDKLFTIISPTIRTHLHLLSRLAFALRDPIFKDVITRHGPRDEILAAVKRVEDALVAPAAAGDAV